MNSEYTYTELEYTFKDDLPSGYNGISCKIQYDVFVPMDDTEDYFLKCRVKLKNLDGRGNPQDRFTTLDEHSKEFRGYASSNPWTFMQCGMWCSGGGTMFTTSHRRGEWGWQTFLEYLRDLEKLGIVSLKTRRHTRRHRQV